MNLNASELALPHLLSLPSCLHFSLATQFPPVTTARLSLDYRKPPRVLGTHALPLGKQLFGAVCPSPFKDYRSCCLPVSGSE